MYAYTCLSVTTMEQQYIGWQLIRIAIHTSTASCSFIFLLEN